MFNKSAERTARKRKKTMAIKINAEMKQFILDNYDPTGDSKEYNTKFFKEMQEKYEGVTVPQVRAILVNAKIYEATSPRSEPKKNGVTKAQLVEKLNGIVGFEIANGMKLTIADLEGLITAFETEEIDFVEAVLDEVTE